MLDSFGRLRDHDIRLPLHTWLLSQHANDPTTVVIHEFKIPRPSARADIAVVNGALEGFEIKSDADSLARLPRQISSFNRVFDRICIVTTTRHEHAVKVGVPKWWGIAIASDQDGIIEFRRVRKSRQNPEVDLRSLLYALYVPELNCVLHLLGGRASVASKSALVDHILQFSPQSVKDASREALKAR